MNKKSRDLYEAAADVLNKEAPITLRGLMYRLVSRGSLPDTTHKSYTRIQRLMTWARETFEDEDMAMPVDGDKSK